MKSLNQSKKFYEDYGKQMINNNFKEYEDDIAVGVVGRGSECLGLSDEISKDHDFEIGFAMWLPEEVYNIIGNSLQDKYIELVNTVFGKYNHNSKYGVFKINDFFINTIGVYKIFEDKEWFLLEDVDLLVAVSGEVFKDELGLFTSYRDYLKDSIPDVWYKRRAKQLTLIEQTGKYNYPRMKVRDIKSANYCFYEFINHVISYVYLVNKEYKPFYKWVLKKMESFDRLKEVIEIINNVYNFKQEISEKTILKITYLIKKDLEKENIKIPQDRLGLAATKLMSKIESSSIKKMNIME